VAIVAALAVSSLSLKLGRAMIAAQAQNATQAQDATQPTQGFGGPPSGPLTAVRRRL
jgi:hypothetical protein